MDTVTLLRRGDFFDIIINGRNCGSGTWAYVRTAEYFYRAEGMKVRYE